MFQIKDTLTQKQRIRWWTQSWQPFSNKQTIVKERT